MIGVVVQNVGRVGSTGHRAAVHLLGLLIFLLAVQGDTEKGEGAAILGPGVHLRPQHLFGGGEITALQGGQRLPDGRGLVRGKTDGDRHEDREKPAGSGT